MLEEFSVKNSDSKPDDTALLPYSHIWPAGLDVDTYDLDDGRLSDI